MTRVVQLFTQSTFGLFIYEAKIQVLNKKFVILEAYIIGRVP